MLSRRAGLLHVRSKAPRGADANTYRATGFPHSPEIPKRGRCRLRAQTVMCRPIRDSHKIDADTFPLKVSEEGDLPCQTPQTGSIHRIQE